MTNEDNAGDVAKYADWLRGIAEKHGKGVAGNIDARSLGRIADLLTDQALRIAELERPVGGAEVYESARTEPSIKVRGVGRDLFEPRSASVALTERPTNEELISLHEYLRGWKP